MSIFVTNCFILFVVGGGWNFISCVSRILRDVFDISYCKTVKVTKFVKRNAKKIEYFIWRFYLSGQQA